MIGIPTGGSISRQIADILLRWLVFIIFKNKIEDWERVTKWWRFIDDIFGLWKGTIEQFHLFMDNLNEQTEPYGIKCDEPQLDISVNFLNMAVYMKREDTGGVKLETKLYRKPTDAMRFLNRNSFHPRSTHLWISTLRTNFKTKH